jgi:hypothetical protein
MFARHFPSIFRRGLRPKDSPWNPATYALFSSSTTFSQLMPEDVAFFRGLLKDENAVVQDQGMLEFFNR